MTSKSSPDSPKQFLHATISKEWNRNIQIFYLNTLTNEIQKTEPTKSTIITNLSNYPKQFLVVKEGKNIEDILSTSAIEDIRVINFENITNKKNRNTSLTRIYVSNPRKDLLNFNLVSNIVEEMEKIKLDTQLFNRLQEYISPKNPNQPTPKNDQPSINFPVTQNKTINEIGTTSPETNQPPITYLVNQIKPNNEISTTSPENNLPSITSQLNQNITNYKSNITPDIPMKLSDLTSHNKPQSPTPATLTSPQSARSLTILSSTNEPITISNLNMEISEIKPIDQSNMMILDDTIYDLSQTNTNSTSYNQTASFPHAPLTSQNTQQISKNPLNQSNTNTTSHPNSWSTFNRELQSELQQNKDIRTLEDSKQDTSKLANLLFNNLNSPQQILEIINQIKLLPRIPPYFHQAIFYKLNFRDRSFFQSFTNDPSKKPVHQKEFFEIENEFITNYKHDHNIKFINFETKKKIRIIICTTLSIIFLRSIDLNKLRHYEIAQQLEYLINYFIRKPNTKIDYPSLLNLLKEKLEANLPPIPNSPNDIPPEIKIKIPFALPIINRAEIIPLVRTLKPYYRFDKLPLLYIKQLDNLPSNPTDLQPQLKTYFPITKRSELKNLSNYKNLLRKEYITPAQLPSSYFNLPPIKKPLPSTYHLLEDKFKQHFPFNSTTTTIKFTDLISNLREIYFFKLLPNDFFYIKPKLPSPQYIKDPDFNFLLPITSSEQASELVSYLSKRYVFNFPLSTEWIQLKNKQPIRSNENKTPLPDDFNIVNKIAQTNFPIKEAKNLKENVIKTGKYFSFTKLPDSWIQITKKPQLPPITELQTFLSLNKINISIPLNRDESFPSKIRSLRQHFSFLRLPTEYITTTSLPDPSFSQFSFSI
jgi:hypothetical protein